MLNALAKDSSAELELTAESRLRLEGVSLSVERSTHGDHTDPRNEVLSNLLAFLRLLFQPHSASGSMATQCLLRDISVAVPAGSVVGVMSTVPASARAVLEVVANAVVPDQGKVVRYGRVASFGQIWCIPSVYDSCRRNLLYLGQLLGATPDEYENAFRVVEQFSKKLPVLDMPLRRTPRWAFADLALVLICELGYEVLVVPEAMLPTSGDVEDYWHDYLGHARERQQVIFLRSRLADNVLPLATHLLLMDGGDLVAFDTTATVRKQHARIVQQALEAREEPKNALPMPEVADDDDDEDEGEEQDAFIDGEKQPAPGALRRTRGEDAFPPRTVSLAQTSRGSVYSNRTSDLCEIMPVDVQGGSEFLRPDMSSAEIDDIEELAFGLENTALQGGAAKNKDAKLLAARSTHMPAMYREEGAVIRLVVETRAPNLWVFPIIDLARRKLTLLRSFGPNEVFVAKPGRVAFDVEIPPDFLQLRLHTVNAIVGIAERERGIDDVAITRELLTFLTLSRERPDRPMPFSKMPLETFFRSTARIGDAPAESDARFQLTGLSLEDISGIPLAHDEDGFEAPRAAAEGFNVVLNVDVSSQPLKLACLVDLRQGKEVALRLTPPAVELAPGGHRLTVAVSAGLLAPNRFEVHVEMMEAEPASGADATEVQTLAAVVHVPEGEDAEYDDELTRWRYGANHGLLQPKWTWRYYNEPASEDGGET